MAVCPVDVDDPVFVEVVAVLVPVVAVLVPVDAFLPPVDAAPLLAEDDCVVAATAEPLELLLLAELLSEPPHAESATASEQIRVQEILECRDTLVHPYEFRWCAFLCPSVEVANCLPSQTTPLFFVKYFRVDAGKLSIKSHSDLHSDLERTRDRRHMRNDYSVDPFARLFFCARKAENLLGVIRSIVCDHGGAAPGGWTRSRHHAIA